MLAERLQLESDEECPHERPGHFIAVVKPVGRVALNR